MAIEIYNKPTISYRLEGFAFFICNAWELLLKSRMLLNNEEIYYSDKPNRTISLSNCITHIFTNDKDPIRKKLEILIRLRNTSTHFVIKEMDSIYLPFMQANVLNYSQKLFDYFGRNITEKIIADNANEKLAIKVDLNVKIVKDKEEAKTTFRIAKDGEEPVRIIKELKDTNLTHCYKQKRVREMVSDNLKRKGIELKLTQYDMKLICDKFDLKRNEKYFYKHELTGSWGCSQQLVDFITDLILKNPDIVNGLKSELR